MIILYNGDCLVEMKKIPDKSVDLILCDLPYGTTDCKWDSIIPMDELWKEYKRLLTDKGNILLFGDGGLFTASLMMTNKTWFKYNWVWKKNISTGFLNAKKQPLRIFEEISVFGRPGQNFYEPQMVKGKKHRVSNNQSSNIYKFKKANRSITISDEWYPTNILELDYKLANKNRYHPSQKPIEVLEYLIKTYSTEGMTVLDNTMGSGSTGVAAVNLNRNFIGIEKDENYFTIAKERIEGVKNEPEV